MNRNPSSPLSGPAKGQAPAPLNKGAYGLQAETGGLRSGSSSQPSSASRPAQQQSTGAYGLEAETSVSRKAPGGFGLGAEVVDPNPGTNLFGSNTSNLPPKQDYGLHSEIPSSEPQAKLYGLQTGSPNLSKGGSAIGLRSNTSSPGAPSGAYGLRSEVSSPARPSSAYGLQSESSTPAKPTSAYSLQSEVATPAKPSSAHGLHSEISSPAKPSSTYGLQSETSSPGRSGSAYGLQSEISSPTSGGSTAYGLQAEVAGSSYVLQADVTATGLQGSTYGLQAEISQTNSQRLLQTPPHSPHSRSNSQFNLAGPPNPSGGSFSSRSSPNTGAYSNPSGDYTTTEFRPLSAQLSQQSFSSSPPRPGSASVSPRCQVVDIKNTAAKFWDSIGPQPHLYLEALSACTPNNQFPENARPSILQTKLKQGRNTIRSILMPSGQAPGSTPAQTPQPPTSPQQLPDPNVLQFSFSLVTAKNVGSTGLARQRQPVAHVARMCMLDKSSSRFVGNVWTASTTEVKNESTWAFDSTDFCIIRYSTKGCDSGSKRTVDPADLSLFIELNISHKLTLEDAAIMPDSERKAAKMVDEVNTCWALINLQRCADLTKEMEVAVPLYCSNMFSPTALDQLVQQERKKHPVKSFFKPVKPAVLIFRAGPLPVGATPLLPYSLMPTNVVASPDICIVLAAFRAALAEQQAVYGPVPCGDPALASFPKIAADNLLLQHFMARWCATTDLQHKIAKGGICFSNSSKEAPPTIDQVVELWRRLCLDVAPMLHAQALPPPHINNFLEYQAHRKSMLDNFTVVVDPITGRATGKQRPPVEPLSHAAYEWLHKPFDVREIRFALPSAW